MAKVLVAVVSLAIIFGAIYGCQNQRSQNASVAPEPDSVIIQKVQPKPAPQPQNQLKPLEKAEISPSPEPEPNEPEPNQATKPPEKADSTPQSEPNEAEDEPEVIAVPDVALEVEQAIQSRPEKKSFQDRFSTIFSTYVDKNGMVDYSTLRRRRAELITAQRQLNALHPAEYMSWSGTEKIALWLNAFNIFTVKLIVDNYPIEPRWYMINYPDSSIKQIPGAWTKNYFKVMGIEYTLNEIEREILLKRFDDPRICFALSYATMGSAILRNEPYYAEKLDKQLDKQIRKFLNNPRNLEIDHNENVIHLSSVFGWYESIFIKKFGSIKKFRDREPNIRAYLNFLVDYIPADDVRKLESKNYIVKFRKYDWRLNDRSSK